ncbi:MAG: hypothetical protein SOZ00_03310 [Tidjanibacter sp.]|nr:hypothetical protein [Tidjanibacter sp.]
MRRLTTIRTVKSEQVERASITDSAQHEQTQAGTTARNESDSLGAESRNLESMGSTLLATNEVIVITTKEYDTEKPIDQQTGRPPLSCETVIEHRKEDGRIEVARKSESSATMSRKTQDTALRDTTSHSSDTRAVQVEQVAQDVQTDESIDHTERRGLNGAQNALCWLGGAVLVALICYLAFMIIKRKLKIF